VKKRLLLFLLSLGVVSGALTWIWFQDLQVRYAMLFRAPAQFVFRQLGIHKSGLLLVIEHFTNLIPFIALTVSLPGINLKRRLARLGLGLAVLAAVHFILIVAVSAVYNAYALSPTAYKYMFPLLIVNDALPLVLWFLLFSEEIIAMFRVKKRDAAVEPTP